MKTTIKAFCVVVFTIVLGCASSGGRSSLEADIAAENMTTESADPTPPSVDLLQTNPEATFKEEAYYPEIAEKAGIGGDVVLRAWVTKSGDARRVRIHRMDSEAFKESALKAGLKYRFKLMYAEGKAVDSWVEFTIHYKAR